MRSNGDSVWELLGLGASPDERPLYVGKSEDSLATRDLLISHCLVAPG